MSFNRLQNLVYVGYAAGAVVAVGCLWWASRSASPHSGKAEGPDDEFRIISAEERYHVWARGIEDRIANMDERLAVLTEGGRALLVEGGANHKMYVQLEEDTTKCLILVDGHDVHNREELRAKRKELVARLSAIAESTSDLAK